jgi:tryptophan 2,3-dioxygenase
MSAALDYSRYLQIEAILNAQQPISGDGDSFEHDEMLFIIIHQVYELWFKELLHELDYLQRRLRAGDTPGALHTFRRLLTILKTVVAQIDVLETMTPLEFNAFRGFLETASGFQSIQFRELEFVLGHKREAILHHFPEGIFGLDRLRRRYAEPTIWDAFLAYLCLNGFAIPAEHLERDVTRPVVASPEIQEILISVYRSEPFVSRICERMVDFDEGLQEWRYRHVKMVARTIGTKKGTGGSAGVEYLSTTIRPAFPDLWAIRARL